MKTVVRNQVCNDLCLAHMGISIFVSQLSPPTPINEQLEFGRFCPSHNTFITKRFSFSAYQVNISHRQIADLKI